MTSPIQMRIPTTLQKVLLICGIIASLFYGAIDIIGGIVWHGYSFASQAISELTAIGAPTRQLLAPLYPIYSLLMIAFGLGVLILAGQRHMLLFIGVLQVIIGFVGLAWMPFPIHMRGVEPTFTDAMHSTFAGVQTLFILSSIGLGTVAYGKRFDYYSIGTLVTLLACGSLTFAIAGQLVPQQLGTWFGLLERITVYGYMVWVIVLAIVLIRVERSQVR
ncbi:MAG: DUF998 domain-containing protein [Thermoproteota archaeon]|jgi:hypothetical protein|nr:DUF998 domain-containing protein [Thermoproteota archaeon]